MEISFKITTVSLESIFLEQQLPYVGTSIILYYKNIPFEFSIYFRYCFHLPRQKVRAVKGGQPVSRDQQRKRSAREQLSQSTPKSRAGSNSVTPQMQSSLVLTQKKQSEINEQRTKFSSPQFWKVTFLRGRLFCLGCRHDIRLTAWQRVLGVAGLS